MDIELSVSVLLVTDSCISLQGGVLEDGSESENGSSTKDSVLGLEVVGEAGLLQLASASDKISNVGMMRLLVVVGSGDVALVSGGAVVEVTNWIFVGVLVDGMEANILETRTGVEALSPFRN
ncbi:hypothetical protein BDR06DRAFT_972670 [Suillus hirtellus]|nr:hypothetical protein BDR06DRAFT_972670 [Suillus hirtellus]